MYHCNNPQRKSEHQIHCNPTSILQNINKCIYNLPWRSLLRYSPEPSSSCCPSWAAGAAVLDRFPILLELFKIRYKRFKTTLHTSKYEKVESIKIPLKRFSTWNLLEHNQSTRRLIAKLVFLFTMNPYPPTNPSSNQRNSSIYSNVSAQSEEER